MPLTPEGTPSRLFIFYNGWFDNKKLIYHIPLPFPFPDQEPGLHRNLAFDGYFTFRFANEPILDAFVKCPGSDEEI